jgi:caa(3)-type oxidase subunit IV
VAAPVPDSLAQAHDPAPTDVPPRNESAAPLVRALIALVALTALSFWLAHLELGGASKLAAIAIAAVKAAVVAISFMEILRASTPARVVALVTIAFIALLCAGTVADVALR